MQLPWPEVPLAPRVPVHRKYGEPFPSACLRPPALPQPVESGGVLRAGAISAGQRHDRLAAGCHEATERLGHDARSNDRYGWTNGSHCGHTTTGQPQGEGTRPWTRLRGIIDDAMRNHV